MFCSGFSSVSGQTVTVSLQSDDSFVGSPTTLTCTYAILDAGFSFWDLEWIKGSSTSDPTAIVIADFYAGASSPSLYNGYDDTSKYSVSRNNADSNSAFSIFSVRLNEDGISL